MLNFDMEKFKVWAAAAAIRALKSAAQGGVMLMGSDAVNIVSLDWPLILGGMATMFVLSILTSLAGLPEVKLANGQQ